MTERQEDLMKIEKGTIVPRTKTIRKPKFILELAVCLAICLTVSSILTNKYLEKRKESAVEMLDEQYYSSMENAGSYLRTYADATGLSGSEFIDHLDLPVETYKYQVETAVYFFGMINGEYGAAYLGREKLAETPYGYYASISFNQYSNKPKGIFLLEDASYIAPLTVYKGGKYDPVENTKRVFKYRAEGEGLETYARMGWVPKFYIIRWESVYVNEETHCFLPGKASITDYFKGVDVDEYDLTPEDTKGYTYVEVGDDSQSMMHGYLDPEKAPRGGGLR